MIQSQDVIVFQGDSITDCHRNRDLQDHANNLPALGMGYAAGVASTLLADRPCDQLQIFNRGISGHRVVDLYARWKIDTLNLKPNLLSILIGVNDTWHGFTRDNGVEVPRYEQIYRMMLDWTVTALPGVRLVLCEPFVLPCGVVTDEWIVEIEQRRAVVQQLAADYQAVFVPFQQMFNDAMTQAPADYWADDGVHPSSAGHHRMAELWLDCVTGKSQ